MEKNINYSAIIGFTFLYVVTVFLCAFIGFLHPACWVFFPALAAFLGAFSYYRLSTKLHCSCLGIILSCALAGLLLCLGEIQWPAAAIMVTAGVLSDIVRKTLGNGSPKAATLSYPILSVGVIGWIYKLWTQTQWYHDGAVEEIGADYADELMKMGSPLYLCLVIITTLVIGYLGICLAKRCMKSEHN